MAGDDYQKTQAFIALFAGGIAGGVESAITYPIEFAKTHVQLYGHGGSRNPFSVVSKVYRQEGLKALYKGCSTVILGSIGKDAVRFLTYDTIRARFEDSEIHTLTPVQSILSGMCAGVAASILAVTPTERVKTALIDDAKTTRRFQSPWHCVKFLVAEKGFRALYVGFLTTTLKQVGTTGARLGGYNIIKDFEHQRGIEQTTMTNFANGAVAGTLTTLLTQPLDTIKTKTQSVQGGGTIDATRAVLQQDGIRGLWRGTVMRLGRTVLAGGILFTANEKATQALRFLAKKPT